MNQLALLSDTPIARRLDPPSSKQAATKVTRDGARAHQQNLVLGGVKLLPGSTSAELAQRIGTDRWVPGRRLSELEKQGLVRRGDMRPCSCTGMSCVTWWPA